MSYTGHQRLLLVAAEQYSNKGYDVGLAKGKKFIEEFLPHSNNRMTTSESLSFDGISVIPNGIVCVDLDEPDFGLIDDPLLPTWKERTPRGWHLFYLLPYDRVFSKEASAKIQWRKHVDLLIKTDSDEQKTVAYGRKPNKKDEPWSRHVIISPTDGYRLVWPEKIPEKIRLPYAPNWLVDAILRK